MTKTYRTHYGENEAEYCRRNGLVPGTLIVGDEGYGPTIFLITALGKRKVLGESSHNGAPFNEEHSLTLSCRDWSILTGDAATQGAEAPTPTP